MISTHYVLIIVLYIVPIMVSINFKLSKTCIGRLWVHKLCLSQKQYWSSANYATVVPNIVVLKMRFFLDKLASTCQIKAVNYTALMVWLCLNLGKIVTILESGQLSIGCMPYVLLQVHQQIYIATKPLRKPWCEIPKLEKQNKLNLVLINYSDSSWSTWSHNKKLIEPFLHSLPHAAI